MRAIERLTLSAYGMHAADQMALAAVPLLAEVLFNASPEVIGILVACQALAHLLGSIPFGLIVDRAQARWVAVAAASISVLGFAGTAAGVYALNLVVFGTSVTLAGFGIVLFVLVGLSMIPMMVEVNGIATANARVEMARAIPSLAAPLLVGLLVDYGFGKQLFGLATAAAAISLVVAFWFPSLEIGSRDKANLFKTILDGGRFVVRQPLLRPIAACAIFWNLAFAALLAILAPLLLNHYHADPKAFGIALSAFGGAVIAGTWVAGRFNRSIAPYVILLLGPGSSFAAALMLLAIPADGSLLGLYAIFFFLGFGPSMWLVAQNSIRQLVTPRHMLGCVNAVIQTAIYGMRPLGALAGGFVAGTLTPTMGAVFVITAFGCSFAAALFSPLRAVQSFAALRA